MPELEMFGRLTTEQARMLEPALRRLEAEFLNPLIGRCFGIMFRRGGLPEPPEDLAGAGKESHG